MADNLTPQVVKTKTAGDVKVDVAQYNGAAVGASNAVHVQPGTGASFTVAQTTASLLNAQAQGNAAHDAVDAGNPVKIGGKASAAAPADVSADGDRVDAWLDRAGRQVVKLDTALPTGSNSIGTVDTELPAAAALADATANPTVPGVGGFLLGYNGTTWDRVRTANTGRLQVDVVTGGGTDTPTTPVMDPKTSAALAANTSVDVDSTDVGSATKKLKQLIMTSGVPLRCELKTVANAVATTRAYFFVPVNDTVIWDAPHRNYVTQGPAGVGFDGFRVSVKNMDNLDAGDVYVTFVTEE